MFVNIVGILYLNKYKEEEVANDKKNPITSKLRLYSLNNLTFSDPNDLAISTCPAYCSPKLKAPNKYRIFIKMP